MNAKAARQQFLVVRNKILQILALVDVVRCQNLNVSQGTVLSEALLIHDFKRKFFALAMHWDVDDLLKVRIKIILVSDNLKEAADTLSIHYKTLMFRKQRLENKGMSKLTLVLVIIASGLIISLCACVIIVLAGGSLLAVFGSS
jgi:hypothetical protein